MNFKATYLRVLTTSPPDKADWWAAKELVDTGYATGSYHIDKSVSGYGEIASLVRFAPTVSGRLFADELADEIKRQTWRYRLVRVGIGIGGLVGVWQRPDGEVIDITPRPFVSDCILFLPDTKRQYAGRQVDNVRKPLVRDNDLVRFFFLLRRRFEILNQGDLANQHGEISLPRKAMREFTDLEKEMTKLQRRLYRRYAAEA